MRHASMTSLVLDLVEWIAKSPKPYSEVMEAWRTSCPRLTIWEDAVDHGFVSHARTEDDIAMVTLTPTGKAFLESNGR